MDLGKPLAEYGTASITDLREKILLQPQSFWESDRANRVSLAGNRPGNAVFFYNDTPMCVQRNAMREAKSGYVNVLRYTDRPLFAEIENLLEVDIKPSFPACDVMRVQIAELPPGDVITPHRDIGILAMIHRLHVPLITHKNVKFIIGRESYFLEEGRLYDLNNVVVHSVRNDSDVMRLHLLVDMLPHSVARARYHDSEDSIIAAVDAWRMAAMA